MRSSKSIIPGAASHISFTGGWLARKSPPYTVSSKCFQVESPSPFKFLAALMPPWAHTECERFTGTIENRSTCPPISAILMTALNPASPPPTTMIRGAAILMRPLSVQRRVPHRNVASVARDVLKSGVEGVETGNSHHRQDHKICQAQTQQSLACLISNDNPPLRAEQPNSVCEVPRCCDQPDHVKCHQPGIVHFGRDFSERCRRVLVQVSPAKSHCVGMPND